MLCGTCWRCEQEKPCFGLPPQEALITIARRHRRLKIEPFLLFLTAVDVACLLLLLLLPLLPLLKFVLCVSSGMRLQDELYWVTNVEQLQFYGGFIAMQSTLGSSCNANTA